ncbi:MAG TPA: hypothetical protein VHE55_01450 [Fimbriimonadaceae bacterium]|nr:hypothetical protein [Fimbriimonadaceae bacterium]
MENASVLAIPQTALQRLEFLAGEYSGRQILYPPGGKSVSYDAYCTISREACERFVKVEFYAEIPEIGIESFTAFVTFSPRRGTYQMWLFSSSAEEPLHMTGDFRGRDLVLISEPWAMPWGLQRLRGTFTPRGNGDFEYLTELWTPDGYTRFRHSVFHRDSIDLEP